MFVRDGKGVSELKIESFTRTVRFVMESYRDDITGALSDGGRCFSSVFYGNSH